MDERNKDLPLIVSEILIEMHEMKEDIKQMNKTLTQVASVVLKQQETLSNHQEYMQTMFKAFQEESANNMRFTTEQIGTVHRDLTAGLEVARQENRQNLIAFQQETDRNIAEIRRQSEEDRAFMTYSINKALGQQQQANAAFEQRLVALEAKYNG